MWSRRLLGQGGSDHPPLDQPRLRIRNKRKTSAPALFLRTPTELESSNFAGRAEKIPGERLEGICEIDADGDVFIRGWVSSIPDV